jgi:hypothetical protein
VEDFTSTRNALAKELSADKQAAATIKSLKKPNLAAWALNQLARKHADKLDELFAVTNKLRSVQRRVLSGGKASDLRKATDERNKVVGRLTKLAESILTKAGHGASSSTLGAIGDSLIAIASEDEGAELLRKGRLTRELEPSPFVDVGGLTLVPSAGEDESEAEDEGAPKRDAAAIQRARRQLAEAQDAAKRARDAHKKATVEAQRLAREATEAERRAKSAHEKADFAERAAEARRADAEAAENATDEARRALEELRQQ